MKDPAKSSDDRLLVTLSVSELREILREIVRAELATANNIQGKGDQAKLFYTTKEAADMLSVEESWLAARARAGKVPHKTVGRYRRFSIEDINAIRQSPPTPIPAKKRKLKNFLHKVPSH
jgi:excisionase family DNA binding protein